MYPLENGGYLIMYILEKNTTSLALEEGFIHAYLNLIISKI